MAATIIRVKVKPLAQMSDGTWLARVKSPPIDGRANQQLIALVAERFGCAQGSVSIKSGASGRVKLVCVDKGVRIEDKTDLRTPPIRMQWHP